MKIEICKAWLVFIIVILFFLASLGQSMSGKEFNGTSPTPLGVSFPDVDEEVAQSIKNIWDQHAHKRNLLLERSGYELFYESFNRSRIPAKPRKCFGPPDTSMNLGKLDMRYNGSYCGGNKSLPQRRCSNRTFFSCDPGVIQATDSRVRNVDTGEEFSSIQEAIDDPDTSNGHTIIASMGIYYENIVIHKSISLIGEDINTTVIDGGGNADTVNITADEVSIKTFTIKNDGWENGVKIRSSNNFISHCNIYSNWLGICIYYSTNNTITECNISNNRGGIILHMSSHNKITKCNISNNWDAIEVRGASSNNKITRCNISNNRGGIYFIYTSNGTIADNIFLQNGVTIAGRYLFQYTHTIKNNMVNGKPLLYFKNENNVILNGVEAGQIILANCTGFRIENVNISNTDVGIEIAFSSNNLITNCSFISNNGLGVWLDFSNKNKITSCDFISNKGDGIVLFASEENTITTCDFISNYDDGIWLYFFSDENTVTYCNLISNNRDGVHIYNSRNNFISNCVFISNSGVGISLQESSNNTISNNAFLQDGIAFLVPYLVPGLHDLFHCIHNIENNVVNGKPLLYFKNENNVILNGVEAGQIILANCTGFRIENVNISNTDVGIEIAFSNNNIIKGCIITSNRWRGIGLSRSNENIITNCNLLANEWDGVKLYRSKSNMIVRCNIASNKRWNGIELESSSKNTIINCNLVSNGWDGIELRNSNSNMIVKCNITSNKRTGTSLSTSDKNTITKCNFISNRQDGIELANSCENTVIKCNVSKNQHGLRFRRSNNNIITNCNVSSNRFAGIELYDSSKNTVTSCNLVSNNRDGILIWHASTNRIFNNVFSQNGIVLYGDVLSHYIHTIENNLVNGKPLLYFKNEKNVILNEPDVGQIILVNCRGFEIKNIGKRDTYIRVQLAFSRGNIITGCNLTSNNRVALRLFCSSKNVITECNLSNSYIGILLINSSKNIVTNCIVSKNLLGISFLESSKNTITKCNISKCKYGLRFLSSENNTVADCGISKNECGIKSRRGSNNNRLYHNTFINNNQSAYDECVNTWDNGNISGGNYWSDFDEPEEGAYDNNSDGRVDTPYNVPGGENVDRYPFIKPFKSRERAINVKLPYHMLKDLVGFS